MVFIDDALLKWTLAKRKMIVQKYGNPGGSALAHTTLLSGVLHDDPHVLASVIIPTLEECTDVCGDTWVSVFNRANTINMQGN
jgi:hypothetical protein